MQEMTLSRRLRAQSGAELVEFALVLPILLFVFGGIVDFGMLLQRQQVVTNAAREGARLAVLPGYGTADVMARVSDYVQEGLSNTTLSPSTTVEQVTIAPASGPEMIGVRVTVTLTTSFLILGPVANLVGAGSAGFGDIVLTSASTMRVEAVSGP